MLLNLSNQSNAFELKINSKKQHFLNNEFKIFLEKSDQLTLTVNNNVRLSFSNDKKVLRYYKSNVLGTGIVYAKEFNNKRYINVTTIGPRIQFMEGCNSLSPAFGKISNFIPAIDDPSLMKYFDESCKSKGVINKDFYTKFKNSFKEDGVSKCVKSDNFKKVAMKSTDLYSDNSFNSSFKDIDQQINNKSEKIKISCFEDSGNSINDKIASIEKTISEQTKEQITNFKFNISKLANQYQTCNNNLEYSIFHEMIHYYDESIPELKVVDLTKMCQSENKELNSKCVQSNAVDGNSAKNECGMIPCSIETDEEFKKINREQSEQATTAIANRLPAETMNPIPETALRDVQDNPVGSANYNRGMEVITNSMLTKLNLVSSAFEKAIAATAPDENLNIPKVVLKNPAYIPISPNDIRNDPDFFPKTLEQPSTNPEPEPPGKRLPSPAKNTNVIKPDNIFPTKTQKVLPLLSDSLNLPESSQNQNQLSEVDKNKYRQAGIYSALNRLVSFGQLTDSKDARDYTNFKNSLSDPKVKKILLIWKIRVVDINGKEIVRSFKNPDMTFVDDGTSLKEVKIK